MRNNMPLTAGSGATNTVRTSFFRGLRRDKAFLAMLFIAISYLIINSYFVSKVDFVFSDNAHYAVLAKNIAQGRGYVVDVVHKYYAPYSPDITHPEDVFPPLYPIIVSLFFVLFGVAGFFSKFPALFFSFIN